MIKTALRGMRRGQSHQQQQNGKVKRSGDAPGFGYFRVIRGYRGYYLGHVPATKAAGSARYYIDKILDSCNINESQVVDSYIEVTPTSLTLYNAVTEDNSSECDATGNVAYKIKTGEINFGATFNDFSASDNCSSLPLPPPIKVTQGKTFDLTRISCCSSNNAQEDGRILSWVYRQETEDGFQMECHAVRFPSSKRANTVARLLYESFSKLYLEVREALRSSKVFYSACEQMSQQNNLPIADKANKMTTKTATACRIMRDRMSQVVNDDSADCANYDSNSDSVENRSDDSVFESISLDSESEYCTASSSESKL